MLSSSFEKNIETLCKQNKKNIAFPESLDQRILYSCHYLLDKQTVNRIFLFCSEKVFLDTVKSLRLNASKVKLFCLYFCPYFIINYAIFLNS